MTTIGEAFAKANDWSRHGLMLEGQRLVKLKDKLKLVNISHWLLPRRPGSTPGLDAIVINRGMGTSRRLKCNLDFTGQGEITI